VPRIPTISTAGFSGRIDSVVTATNYSSQYVNSPNYSAGFGDLYTYGSWFPRGGYGYCWRPFGNELWLVALQLPGGWYQDPFFGISLSDRRRGVGCPITIGGWIFSPAYGWVWGAYGLCFGGPVYYRPVTAVWVRNGGTLGSFPASGRQAGKDRA